MRRSAGFTLLEVLVAVSIFTLVAAAAYGTLHVSREAQRRGEARAEVAQVGRQSIAMIRRDLEGILANGSVFDGGLIGEDNGSLSGLPADKLQCYTASNVPGPTSENESDLMQVGYILDDDPSTPEQGLLRSRLRLLSALAAREEDLYVFEEIAPEVIGLGFRFWDGTAWAEEWDSTDDGTMPSAIEVTVYLADPLGRDPESLDGGFFAEEADDENLEDRTFQTVVYLSIQPADLPRGGGDR